ncbi:vancomycin resistance protein [Sorangium cellulosum]|uniref:Vancomycin resistance protein n=1 Tax=Sorangium cellulosum TaxID=56 RepID=A0A4P2Q4S1_SORCE|nr:VanW family protein [Sorangium cellulosum]AUX24387.1 vancomycin resistance protein [Sorangium cellulosum]
MGTRAAVLVLALGASAGVGAAVAVREALPASPVVRGLSIDERVVPDGASPAAWLGSRRDALRERVVRLHHDDVALTATLGEAGVEVDVAATLAAAERVGHEGPWLRRIREARRARRGEIDVPLVWSLDEQRARALFERLAPQVYRAPVDARLDLANRRKIPEQPGRELDIEASIEALRAGSHDEEEVVTLAVRPIAPAVVVSDLVNVDVSKVVAVYETKFKRHGKEAGRAANIANAAARIDGTILAPGETFSFNTHVGPRTRKNGFTIAPEILGDEMIPGYGGGTCQVSSTLYAASLFGALDTPDRQSHSRPSAYIPMGLDAMVTYPESDLKIRNTLPFPIMIRAYLPTPTVIRVEILGGDPVAEVEHHVAAEHTDDFVRRIYVKSELSEGKVRRHQKGSCGYDVRSFVTLRYKDGRIGERSYTSEYKPAPEVFWVAPDYDPSELPPLSEHTKTVEELFEQESPSPEGQGGGYSM